MAGYVMLDAEVIDPMLYRDFREQLLPLLEEQGGKLVARGRIIEAAEGEVEGHRRVLMMEFDTVEQARAWPMLAHISSAYAELRKLRDNAAKVSMFILDSDAPVM